MPLVETLLDLGLISDKQFAVYRDREVEVENYPGEFLVEAGYLTATQIAMALAGHLDIPFVPGAWLEVDKTASQLVSREQALLYLALPIGIEGESAKVAMVDPTNLGHREEIAFLLGRTVQPVITTYDDLMQAIQRNLGDAQEEAALRFVLEEVRSQYLEDEEDEAQLLEEILGSDDQVERPISRLVQQTIELGIQKACSDLHFEPVGQGLVVRGRIDGVLVELMDIPKSIQAGVVSRLKVLGNLDIAEKRLPQDGRIRVNHRGRDLDLRVSTLPGLEGETVVLRILHQKRIDLAELGLDGRSMACLTRSIEKPQGMILVTGPTGSGKTTTLYGALGAIVQRSVKTVTIEDPVEYRLEGVTQVPVRAHIGLTFAKVLRSVLRQDPDVILVGEIRDAETAEIAMQASMTGHLVLSTLHTNSAVATIARLRDLGVDPTTLYSSLLAIFAQRLVRRICRECKAPHQPSPALLERLGRPATGTYWSGKGCMECHRTGYLGRIGVYETLEVGGEVRRLIGESASEHKILTAARAAGMETLLEVAMTKVDEGVTTVEELLRVIPTDESAPVAERPAPPPLSPPSKPVCSSCAREMDAAWRNCPFCGALISRER
ncbi:MAG: type II/IV secretion system protein [Planctomycetes bacterium]|nr:type II/IV secretion system protein [Planctomycetota bacterium]